MAFGVAAVYAESDDSGENHPACVNAQGGDDDSSGETRSASSREGTERDDDINGSEASDEIDGNGGDYRLEGAPATTSAAITATTTSRRPRRRRARRWPRR